MKLLCSSLLPLSAAALLAATTNSSWIIVAIIAGYGGLQQLGGAWGFSTI
jgi:hypothetical protein